MTVNTEGHADSAVAIIKFVRALELTPPQQIMVLATAADILENEMSAASTALILQQALNPER